MDEGELLQTVWPRWVDRQVDIKRHCYSCSPGAEGSFVFKGWSTETCAFVCPEILHIRSLSSDAIQTRWSDFWESSPYTGHCSCCSCNVTPPSCTCRNNWALSSDPAPVDILFRQFQYFWGASKSHWLLEKTPDLAPWLKLALFPTSVTFSLTVIRHPYYQMRCDATTQGPGHCVTQWLEGLRYLVRRLDGDPLQRWAVVRYEDVAIAESTTLSCLHRAIGLEVGRRRLWGYHEMRPGEAMSHRVWKRRNESFVYQACAGSVPKNFVSVPACLDWLGRNERAVYNDFGYSLTFDQGSWIHPLPTGPLVRKSSHFSAACERERST